MALFDNINSRYTQSMAEGGSYRRDAAEGGYDRKELRGLSKQAKSGSLTQRERARYNYLKKERKGRRKRGLLAGLGGAAALAGGLAAAGKLGKGDGSLMDSIKNRFAQRRDKKLNKEFGEENLASAIEGSEDKEVDIDNVEVNDLSDMLLEEEGDVEGDKTGEQLKREALDSRTEIGRRMREEGEYNTQMDLGRHSNMQEPSDMELYDEYGKSFDGMEGELRARNKASQVLNPPPGRRLGRWTAEDIYDQGEGSKLGRSEKMAPGGVRGNLGGSFLADLEDLKFNTNFAALEPKLGDSAAWDAASAYSYGDDEGYLRPMGYEAEGIPAEGRPLTEADALRSRMARRPGQPYDRSGLPDPEYRVGPPVRTGGPRAKFGMKVKTQKQEKLDRLRKFMKNRYR